MQCIKPFTFFFFFELLVDNFLNPNYIILKFYINMQLMNVDLIFAEFKKSNHDDERVGGTSKIETFF